MEATQALEISCTKRQAVSGHHSHCERAKARMSKCLLLGHRRGWECKGSTHPCNTWAAPKTHTLGSWELCQSRALHSQSWGISGSLQREINLVNRWQSHRLRGAGELVPCRRHRDKKFYCHRANEDHLAGPRLEDFMGRARDSSTAKPQGKKNSHHERSNIQGRERLWGLHPQRSSTGGALVQLHSWLCFSRQLGQGPPELLSSP